MGTQMVETTAKLVWGELADMLTTALPFRVVVTAENENKEPLSDYSGHLTISALTPKVCLSEGFEGRRLGLWCAATRTTTRHSRCFFAAFSPSFPP